MRAGSDASCTSSLGQNELMGEPLVVHCPHCLSPNVVFFPNHPIPEYPDMPNVPATMICRSCGNIAVEGATRSADG